MTSPDARFDRRWFLRRGAQAAALAVAGPAVLDTLGRIDGLGGLGGLGGTEHAVVDLGGARPIAAVPAPGIVTRAGWGADESLRSGTPHFSGIRKMVVHHTVTTNDEDDPYERVRAIYRFHTSKAEPFNDIGYNFVVDQWGRVYEGRWAQDYDPGEVHDGENDQNEGVIGAHAKYHNTGTVGVALLGTFNGAEPTDAAVESLVKVLAWVSSRHGIDPLESEPYTNSNDETVVLPNIMGHRDTRGSQSGDCPGDQFYAMLPEIRRQVALTVSDGFIGYRIVSSSGDVAPFGGARDYGGLGALGVDTRVVGAAGQPGRQGYWILDRVGGVFAFGGAPYLGSIPELARTRSIGASPAVGIAATPTGGGYWVLDEHGGIFSFGDADFHGSVPELRSRGHSIGPGRVLAMAPTPTGGGYWVLDEHGGIFSFGDADFHGSVPELRSRGHSIGEARTVSMAPTPTGGGYWVLDDAGGVFSFGDARYRGSVPELGIDDRPVRRIVAAPDGRGYVVLSASGAVYAFGSAPFHGRWVAPGLDAVDLAPVIRT